MTFFQQRRIAMGCSDVTGVILRSMATERIQKDAEFTASGIVVF
jgi:hypothetical protein